MHGRGERAGAESPIRAGDLVGSIVGAPPGSMVMHQNVTVAEAIVPLMLRRGAAAQPHRLRGGALPLPVRYVQQAWSRFGAEVVVCDDA